MKIAATVWGSESPLLQEAARSLGIDLYCRTTYDLVEPAELRRFVDEAATADLVLFHPSQDPYWDELVPLLRKGVPVVSFGYDQAHWALSTVPLEVTATINAYFVYGGQENISRMVGYLLATVLHQPVVTSPPLETRWDGIYHPRADTVFGSTEEYFAWYQPKDRPTIGLFFYRLYWVSGDLKVVDAFVRETEQYANVIPVFCIGTGDREAGALPGNEVIEKYFRGRVDALVNLQSITLAATPEGAVQSLKDLDVPVFHPLMLYHRDQAAWEESHDGMKSSEIGWSVVVPEFQGMIEMLPAGAAAPGGPGAGDTEWHVPIDDRVRRIVARALNWVSLRSKPNATKKVAIILNNSPCAALEATVGSAAHLDAPESVARILQALAGQGYSVTPPADGKELISTIMDRKAVSEFRWTSVGEIVAQGGALGKVPVGQYRAWFSDLHPALREKIVSVWGEPPGHARDGVPAAMVHDGELVITGVSFGNAVVCTQPKRGCAGSRCDGEVCRILHDPETPPPHHYLATYRYLTEVFGADVIVHVGTHGTLEFLPGKSVALSEQCLPDAIIGKVPFLYVYNSDNPPEGTIAKRRSHAVLVDHMQTVMSGSGLYGDLKELEERIAEYRRAGPDQKARTHALEHVIADLIRKNRLEHEVGLESPDGEAVSFETVVEAAHDALTRIYNTQIPEGMHVFGDVPRGEDRVAFIVSVLRHGGELRKLVLSLMGIDMVPSEAELGLLRVLDDLSSALVRAFLEGEEADEAVDRVLGGRLKRHDPAAVLAAREKVLDIASRMDASDETGSLLRGFSGHYIEPGPSGLITRGKPEILPTGRNFYTLDPASVPTEAAHRIGRKLADILVERYRKDHGAYPENIGIYWTASDIMWSEGEQFAQILHLIGTEPVWKQGRVTGFRVIPLRELGRPRVDVTVRVSGILRDCFGCCIEVLDDAVRAVAALDEPDEMNFVRKHAEKQEEPFRIFSSRAGVYGMGVNLAVYASAWKEKKDLAGIYVHWNGYAYGRGTFGVPAHEQFDEQLKTVGLTFNKTATDEYDLIGCCCYFGAHGGLTVAAREASGHDIPVYYGDTREADSIEVRTLAEEITRVVRTKLLNPKYIEALKKHGYAGASEITKRVGRVYGWDATTDEVEDWVFDDIARTFLLDPDMKRFFEEENPWGLEEIGRRLLEANQRGLWDADPEVLEGVRSTYLEVEGWLEDERGDSGGAVQGGAVDVFTPDDVAAWKELMAKTAHGKGR